MIKEGGRLQTVELVIRIADYVFRDKEKVRKGFGDVMGGKVLELESDKLIQRGIEQGIAMERKKTEAAEAEIQRLKKLLEEKKVCRTIPGKRLSELLSASEYSGEESFAGLSYPLIIKPEDGRSSQGLRRIFDSQEMELAVSQLKGQAERYLVQPLISGGITTADVVRSHETGACVCLPRRELLRTLNGAGTSVQVFRDPVLEKICEEIAGALDVKGCVNFEFIEHHTEQGETEWYFLECNPRFAGGVAFSCMAGYDMVKNHLRCFAGKEPEPAGKIQNQYIARRYTEYRMKEDTNE